MPDIASGTIAYAGHDPYGESPRFPNPETDT